MIFHWLIRLTIIKKRFSDLFVDEEEDDVAMYDIEKCKKYDNDENTNEIGAKTINYHIMKTLMSKTVPSWKILWVYIYLIEYRSRIALYYKII